MRNYRDKRSVIYLHRLWRRDISVGIAHTSTPSYVSIVYSLTEHGDFISYVRSLRLLVVNEYKALTECEGQCSR